MPGRNEIAAEILSAKNAAQDNVRRNYLADLSLYTERDTILYLTAYSTTKMSQINPMHVSVSSDDIHGFMSAIHGLKNQKLDLILHSPGGSAEAAEQIVNYLRAKFEHIRAIIPQNAMSAATMIACACDEIILGKHSAIGPIDPQITIPTQTGTITVPAQSLLSEFEQAKKEILDDPKIAPAWINKLTNLPFGILDICNNTTKLSIEKVESWLKTYMFKEDRDKDAKSQKIAHWLGTSSNHLTHGRPIPYRIAQEEGLKVKELEEDPVLQEKVLSVFHSAIVTIEVTDCVKIIENQKGKGTYLQYRAA